jgi:hypothetical protein
MGGLRLEKLHVEILHLDRARSALSEEGLPSPLPSHVPGFHGQQFSEMLKVLEANAAKKADSLNPSEGKLWGKAAQERVIAAHRDFVTKEAVIADLKDKRGPLIEEFRDLFAGVV